MQNRPTLTVDELDGRLEWFLSKWKAIGQKNIATFANRFCEKFGVMELPRDPRDYLPLLGIAIEHAQWHPENRATWVRTEAGYRIEVSRLLIGPQLSFAIWHEVFEIMSAHPAFPHLLPSPHEERLSNAFATHVLMPASDVRRMCAELHHPEQDKTVTLAHRFGVSLSAMRYRLRELGLQHHDNRFRRVY